MKGKHKRDVLAWMSNSPRYQIPITSEEAKECVDLIVPYDNDLTAHALIRLLNGIFTVAFNFYLKNEGEDPEQIVSDATYMAYERTLHFDRAYSEFATLDWNKKRELRVLRGDFDKPQEDARDERADG